MPAIVEGLPSRDWARNRHYKVMAVIVVPRRDFLEIAFMRSDGSEKCFERVTASSHNRLRALLVGAESKVNYRGVIFFWRSGGLCDRKMIVKKFEKRR